MKYDRRTDRSALSTFFKATGGPYWRQKRGWEDGSDNLDVWGGVSVNASRRAIRINVMENNLKGARDICLAMPSLCFSLLSSEAANRQLFSKLNT